MHANRAGGQQNQPEHGVGCFPFSEDRVRNFADERQGDSGGVIAVHIHKGFDQLALVDAHQLARFALEIPDADVRQDFERRSKAIFGEARAARHAAYAAGLAIEKTDQPVALAKRKGAQNNRLGLLEWHSFCRRADRP